MLIEFEYTNISHIISSSFLSSLLQPQPPPTTCGSQKWAYINGQCVRGSSDSDISDDTAEDCCDGIPNCSWKDTCSDCTGECSGVFNTPEPTVRSPLLLLALSYLVHLYLSFISRLNSYYTLLNDTHSLHQHLNQHLDLPTSPR